MSGRIERRKYTVPQLSRLWGVSPNKILEFIRRGELRAVDLASHRSTRPRYAIDVNDIAAFEVSRQVVPTTDERPTRRPRQREPKAVKEFF